MGSRPGHGIGRPGSAVRHDPESDVVVLVSGRILIEPEREAILPTMEQPHHNAALGPEPIRTIDRGELEAKLDRGDPIKLIMALNRWAFDAKHIPGSVHFDTPEELYAAVRPDDEVIVYCSHVDCLSSVALYRDLVRRGYRNVRRYSGGLLDWEDAGLPLEGEFAAAR